MKIGKLALKASIRWGIAGDAKRRESFPPHGTYREKLDIPYLDDGEELHKFDVFYADKSKDNYKNVVVVDFHGGAFLFGYRKNAYLLALEFLKRGYDFIAGDYIPVKGNRGVDDLVSDCASCLGYIATHKEVLELEGKRFVLTGDSAGGLLVLDLQLAIDDKEYEKALGIDLKGFASEAVLVNCPVFDYESNFETNSMTMGAKRMMLGPRYSDYEYLHLYSPKTQFHRLRAPIFVSTCKKDFIRMHPVQLMETLKKRDDLFYKTVDIQEDDVYHVHNVNVPDQPASVEVNEAMARFIVDALRIGE